MPRMRAPSARTDVGSIRLRDAQGRGQGGNTDRREARPDLLHVDCFGRPSRSWFGAPSSFRGLMPPLRLGVAAVVSCGTERVGVPWVPDLNSSPGGSVGDWSKCPSGQRVQSRDGTDRFAERVAQSSRLRRRRTRGGGALCRYRTGKAAAAGSDVAGLRGTSANSRGVGSLAIFTKMPRFAVVTSMPSHPAAGVSTVR